MDVCFNVKTHFNAAVVHIWERIQEKENTPATERAVEKYQREWRW